MSFTQTYTFVQMEFLCDLSCISQSPIRLPNLLDKINFLAFENISFSMLFTAGDVLRGGTSATQRQKFHTDDANQCLLNKSGSHGVPNVNLFNFRFLLVNLVKCCVHLRTSSSKTQMLVLEKTIFHKY